MMPYLYLLSLLLIALLQCNLHLVRAILMHEEDSSESHATRIRRRVGHLNSSPALDYIKEIQSNITDQEGRLKDFTFSTSVWCMMDRDITDKNYRPSPKQPDSKCESISRYIFDMQSISNSISTKSFPLAKSCFRPYMQSINKFMNEDGLPLPVHLSISMKFVETEDVATLNSTVEMSGSDIHLTTINSTRESNHWLELEVTEAFKRIWPPTENTHLLEIALKMSINCNQGKGKVPLTFVNPAEVLLTHKIRRLRDEEYQPLFLIYIDDSQVKQRIQSNHMDVELQASDDMTDLANEVGSEDEEEDTKSGDIDYGTSVESVQRRNKRAATKDSEKCRTQDFTVNFSDLKLDRILEPREVNIKQCRGRCDHNAIKTNFRISTNHAKIMSSAHELHRTRSYRDPNSQMYLQSPKALCCVPHAYDALPLIVEFRRSYLLHTFPDSIALSCRCA